MWNDALVITVMGVLLAVNAVGVVLVALQLPGTWLMLLAAVLATWWEVWWEAVPWSQAMITPWTLLILLALAVIGEVVEFAAGAAGAGKAGASRRGIAGALVMGVVGAIIGTFALPIPIVGTLVGAAVGSGIGSIAGDLWAGRKWSPALAAGRGAAIGRFKGAVGKLIIAAVMWLVTLGAVLWP